MSVIAATTLMSEIPIPRPKSAVRMGSPIATTDPNTNKQDHDRGEQPDQVGVALRWLVCVVDDRAAVREADAGLLRGLGGRGDPVERAEPDLLCELVVLHGDERDVARLRDDRRAERTVGIGHRRDVWDLGEVRHALADRRLHGGVVDAVGGLEDDGRGTPRLGRELRFQEIERFLRLASVDPEVVGGLAVEALGQEPDADGRDHPHRDEPPPVPNRVPSESVEPPRHRSSQCSCLLCPLPPLPLCCRPRAAPP